MKFAKGQRVLIVPLAKVGTILHGFVIKRYAQPDVYHYTIHVEREDETYEVGEENLE